MADFFSRVGSSSQPNTPNKIYVGTVKKVRTSDNKLRVRVPQLGQDTDYIPAIASGTVNHYQEGDKVLCAFIDGRLNELFVLGRYSYRPNSEVDIGDDLSLGGDLVVNGNLTVDTDTLYVNSATNSVGVGTSNPTYMFEVDGSAKTRSLTVEGAGFDSTSLYIVKPSEGTGFIQKGDGYVSIGAINDAETAYQDVAIAPEGGKVGIGTYSPNRDLHIQQASSGATAYGLTGGIDLESNNISGINILSPNTGYGRIYFGAPVSNTAGAVEYIHNATVTDGYMKFRAGAADRMHILGNGNVGINDSTPSYTLDVNGTGQFTGAVIISGGLSGFDLTNGISGSNFNITGVNQIDINDSGEGINFPNVQLYQDTGDTDMLVCTGSFRPSVTNSEDLGTSTYRWRNIYTQDLHLSNGIGDYTIIEGEEDLYLTNNKTGKSFKFALIEVDPTEVPSKSEVD